MADVLIDGPPVGAPKAPTGLEHDRGVSASAVREHTVPSPTRHLSHMLMATMVVAVLPLVLSLTLRASGVISSGWLSLGLAMALSLAASGAGSAYWRKRGAHGEVLFSDLLVWGWIRRWRQERELADAARLLDLVNPGFTERGHPALNADESLSVDQHAQLLRQLAGALEGQDVYLNGHSRRVARHAAMIARGMGLPSDEVARVRAAAAVHDIGKLRTPKAILNKPGRLTDDEFEVIKRHPVDGAEMVAALGDPELTRIVRHHHERLDGAGYPGRLSGERDPARGPDHRGRRHVRCDHVRSPLPRRRAPPEGDRHPARRGRRAARSRSGARLLDLLLGEPPDRRVVDRDLLGPPAGVLAERRSRRRRVADREQGGRRDGSHGGDRRRGRRRSGPGRSSWGSSRGDGPHRPDATSERRLHPAKAGQRDIRAGRRERPAAPPG